MCRNIRTLYNIAPPAADDEVRAAVLQDVRKISGYAKPSQANAEAFEATVEEIARVSARLLASLETAALRRRGGDVQGRGYPRDRRAPPRPHDP